MSSLKFRKSLMGISGQLSRQDLELLKFICEVDVPKARMERVVSGTDLFQALEERGKLSSKNLGFLVDILGSIGRGKLIDTYLKSEGFVIPPTSLQVTGYGGTIGNQTVQYLFRDCLAKIAQGLQSTEVNSLVFLFQSHLQCSPDMVFSATQLFTLLQQRQIVTSKNMRLLYEGLVQVNRNDLANLVNEFMMKTGQRSYQGEQQGMITVRAGHQGQPPVQESNPATVYNDPAYGMLPGYQPGYSQPHPGTDCYQPPNRSSSSTSSLSSDAHPSISTPPSSSTTTDYPPAIVPGGFGTQPVPTQGYQMYRPEFTPSKPPWDTRLPSHQPDRNVSGEVEIQPFGFNFNVFEAPSQPGSSPASVREEAQHKLLQDLAMKQGELVGKEEEIQRLKVKLEVANSDKSKAYNDKLGEAEKFKQNIRDLEKMLKTKNEEVAGLAYELQHFHIQMENMQAAIPFDEKEFYRMDRNPHGICVIINNHKFYHPTDKEKAHNDRGGAEVDQKNLQLTFQYLRYIVETYENLTHTQMMEVMLSTAHRNHANYDSFICCILTHGEQDMVHGADSIPVSLLDLTGVMKMSSTLINKPKMFFIQACRGDREDEGHKMEVEEEVTQRDSGGKQPPSAHTIPQEADFFYGYATPLGNAAYRSRRHGSWYISELCKVLTRHAYTSNLSNMMRKVNDNVCKAFTKEGYKQTAEFVDRLRKGVHFFHFSKVQQQQQLQHASPSH